MDQIDTRDIMISEDITHVMQESDAKKKSISFTAPPGFCPDCGSILPMLGERGSVICYACKREWGSEGILRTTNSNKQVKNFVTSIEISPQCLQLYQKLYPKIFHVCSGTFFENDNFNFVYLYVASLNLEFFFTVFGDMALTYKIHMNSRMAYKSAKDSDDSDNDADGPIVERKCPQCQNDTMSYATLQLRSADEGQTVFYTCTKCKYVEICGNFHEHVALQFQI